jgi:APA family basic amino acid/polyamine antiporter
MSSTDKSSRGAGLVRRLGLFTAASVVVANVVGSGIFTTSGYLARDLSNPVALLLVWLAGGILALAGALSYSELGAAMPEAGGEYVYLREAYSPLVGFLSGWMSLFIAFSGAIASTALLFSHYLSHFIPAVEPQAIRWSAVWSALTAWHSISALWQLVPPGIGVAIGLVWVLAIVHITGLGPGGAVQRLLTSANIACIVLVVIAGFALGTGSVSHIRSGGPAVWGAFPVSLVFVMFAYSGWNAAAYLAGEIHDPGRTLPRALVLGTLVVAVLYLGLNCFYLYALPIDQMAGVAAVAERASVNAFGPVATHLVAVVVMLAIAGCTSAMVLAGPRVYYAMARDGVFPQSIAAVSPRFRTPARSIILQSVWTTILILFWSSLERLIVYTGLALVVFSAMAVLAVFVLRVRRPDLPRPFRVPLYPVVPGLFVLASIWMAVFTLRGRPKESLLGLLTVAAGVPFYFLLRFLNKRGREVASARGTAADPD